MEKSLTDIMLTHTLLDNIINLENIITKKDSEIVNLKKEIKRLKTLVSELTERNISQPDKIHNYVKSMFIPLNATNDAMQYITDKYNNKVEKLYAKNINQEKNIKEEKDKSHSLAGKVSFDENNEAQAAIFIICEKLCSMLIRKNQSYGNAAFDPLRIFSKADIREQILVRIDDKISRISRGNEFLGDDTITDLTGYLIVLMAWDVMRKQQGN
jgi:archaellum component FlaC